MVLAFLGWSDHKENMGCLIVIITKEKRKQGKEIGNARDFVFKHWSG